VLKRGFIRVVLPGLIVLSGSGPIWAQNPASPQEPPPEHVHDMSKMDMPMQMEPQNGWRLMQDGTVNLLINSQGGPRGGDEFKVPNWWMGMAERRLGRGDLTLTGMFSLDPATVGSSGYREIFQVGEAIDDKPIVDHQHPHDLWMQIAAAWRTMVRGQTGITLAGGVSGEPALGPVAFMHRASAAAIPFAPLGHHTFDSTHIAFGVATVGVDRGPVAVEGSVFNGREPDQHRWDFDFGSMDSVSGRLWYRPSKTWEFQVSSAHLVEPEQLHEGNVVRTTMSGAYTAADAAHLTAATVGYGMNVTDDVTRRAGFGEFTKAWGPTLASARIEFVEVETELLRLGALPETPEGEARKDVVGAFTFGGQRDLARGRGMIAALGANLTLYRVPEALRDTHGDHPVSFQVFFQIRPQPGAMGRMWNMRMGGAPMTASEHAGHQD
jgi:hypothetical protein